MYVSKTGKFYESCADIQTQLVTDRAVQAHKDLREAYALVKSLNRETMSFSGIYCTPKPLDSDLLADILKTSEWCPGCDC